MTKARYDRKSTKVWTGPVRFSYPNLFETAKGMKGEDTGRYTVTLLVPKTDKETFVALSQAIEDLRTDKLGAKAVKGLKLPIKDGDTQADETGREETRGFWVVPCGSPNQPGIVDQAAKTILTKAERDAKARRAETDPKAAKEMEEISDLTDKHVYAGSWGRVTVNPYGWGQMFNGKVNPGGNGISFSLQNVQKLNTPEGMDDKAFSGKVEASSDFESTESEDNSVSGSTDEQYKRLMGISN